MDLGHSPSSSSAQAKVDIDAGRLRHEARCTVGDLANEWLEAVRPNRKASTFSTWDRLMRAYVVPRVGHVRLDRLSPAVVQSCTPSCAVQVLGVVSPCPALKSATSTGSYTTPSTMRSRVGYLTPNPTDAIDKPRNDTEEQPVYTPEQVRRLMVGRGRRPAPGDVTLVLATGLRRAELAGLRWRDVALDRPRRHSRCVLRVRPQASGGRTRPEEQVEPAPCSP